MHKFNPEKVDRLESPERQQKLPPEIVVDKINISEGGTVVDLGCGTGYFTLPLSEKVGDKGKVYAVDISEQLLNVLKEKTKKVENIIPILSDENEFKVEERSVDVVFMAFILHEAIDKKIFLSNVIKLLKRKGRIVVIDWQKKETDSGPPVEDRLDINEVGELFCKQHFRKIKEIQQHSDIYFLIFQSKE